MWKKFAKVEKFKKDKKVMKAFGTKMIMVTKHEGEYYATDALCRHMRWPLAWGAKVQDGCVRCPLHQTTHELESGNLKEWSPFPLFPPYGKLVGKLVKPKDLGTYELKIEDGNIFVKIDGRGE